MNIRGRQFTQASSSQIEALFFSLPSVRLGIVQSTLRLPLAPTPFLAVGNSLHSLCLVQLARQSSASLMKVDSIIHAQGYRKLPIASDHHCVYCMGQQQPSNETESSLRVCDASLVRWWRNVFPHKPFAFVATTFFLVCPFAPYPSNLARDIILLRPLCGGTHTKTENNKNKSNDKRRAQSILFFVLFLCWPRPVRLSELSSAKNLRVIQFSSTSQDLRAVVAGKNIHWGVEENGVFCVLTEQRGLLFAETKGFPRFFIVQDSSNEVAF